MVSATVVRMSPDLGVAKVYVSIFGVKNVKEVFENIQMHSSQIRGIIGKSVGRDMRKVPEFHFYLDDTLDYVENIDRLLDKDKKDTSEEE